MNDWIKAEYFRLRALGWYATQAFDAAKVNDAWEDAEAEGLVRVRAEPEECIPIEDFAPEFENSEEENRWYAHVNNVGIWVFFTEYLDPIHGWTLADSIGGVIGDDWEDSGYDVDLKRNALDALESVDPKLCQGWC